MFNAAFSLILLNCEPNLHSFILKTVRDLLNQLSTALAPVYPEPEAAAIARLVAEVVLQLTPLQLRMEQERPVPAGVSEKINAIIERLLKHEPVQYVLGRAYFYGMELRVQPGVLIPRPETEELVDRIVQENRQQPRLQVLDIGTGSGCIALALAANLPEAQVWGLDVSEAALAVAKQNAQELQLPVQWLQTDILTQEPPLPLHTLDILVSNPPYVLEQEREQMRRNVLDYEPHTALFVPDHDALLFYRRIAQVGRELLRLGGKLYFEINEQFGTQTAGMLAQEGYGNIRIHHDIFGKQRMVQAIRA